MDESVSWRKSSRSGKQGNCVTWDIRDDEVLVGHSKMPGVILVRYTRAEWQAFVEGVKLGEADL